VRKLHLAIITIFVLAALSGCGYNTMQANEEAVTAAWGNVESSYQRRSDLVATLYELLCVGYGGRLRHLPFEQSDRVI